MKIVFFEVENWEEEYLKKSFPSAGFFDSPLTQAKIKKVKDAEIISVFIYSKLDEAKLKRLPNLKMIVTRSTGFDHIDLNYCQKNKITITNVPTYGENTVAEFAFALILAISRKIIPAVERAKTGDFNLTGLRGFDLRAKTIGIVGTGSIGEHMARMAVGFEMKILGFDLKQNPELAKKFGLKYTRNLEELFASSDIISLHLPLNEHTQHIVNKELMEKTKHGAILINTARGGLVDSEDLMWALDNNIFAAAGLDVLEEEPLILEERELLHHNYKSEELKSFICEQMLLRHPKVLVTPHNAFNSHEALQRILDVTVSNIKNFVSRHERNIVQ
jgi:D-lactate dehydrogenase